MTKISIAKHHDTLTAMRQVLSGCGAVNAALLLIFAASRHDPVQVLSAIQSIVPNVPTFGGSIVGTVTRSEVGYGGYEIAAIAFPSGPNLPYVVIAGAGETNDMDIGFSLGKAIATSPRETHSILMFYTSVSDRSNRRLHYGTDVLAGLIKGIDNSAIDIAGGGLLTSFNFDDSWIIAPDGVRRHSAFALVFPDHLCFETRVLHACRPVGQSMTITAQVGARILTLDGVPALDMLCAQLGREPTSDGNTLGLDLCLGRFVDPLSSEDGENENVNRVIVSEDVITRSICLLEPDFNVGDRVCFMLRDNDYMMSSAANIEMNSVEDSLLSIYIDCAGRASVLTGTLEEEGIIAMSTLPRNIPALGIYSGVEIASAGKMPRALDLTGVMISVVPRHS